MTWFLLQSSETSPLHTTEYICDQIAEGQHNQKSKRGGIAFWFGKWNNTCYLFVWTSIKEIVAQANYLLYS